MTDEFWARERIFVTVRQLENLPEAANSHQISVALGISHTALNGWIKNGLRVTPILVGKKRLLQIEKHDLVDWLVRNDRLRT